MAAAVDDSIQAVRRSAQTCAAEFQHMEAVTEDAETVCPFMNLALTHCHLRRALTIPAVPLTSATCIQLLSRSNTTQAVLFAATRSNQDQPDEQLTRDGSSLLRLNIEEFHDVTPLHVEQQVAAESDRSPAAAHGDSLLRMATVLDALAAEQKLMVSAALLSFLQ